MSESESLRWWYACNTDKRLTYAVQHLHDQLRAVRHELHGLHAVRLLALEQRHRRLVRLLARPDSAWVRLLALEVS